jgi:hypothetical protein
VFSVNARGLVDEPGRIRRAAWLVDGTHEGVDLAFIIAHAAKGHALGQPEAEEAAQLVHGAAADLVGPTSTWYAKSPRSGTVLKFFMMFGSKNNVIVTTEPRDAPLHL